MAVTVFTLIISGIPTESCRADRTAGGDIAETIGMLGTTAGKKSCIAGCRRRVTGGTGYQGVVCGGIVAADGTTIAIGVGMLVVGL